MLSEVSQSEKDKYRMIQSYVESNEQTELRSKTETDSQIESRQTAMGEGLSKKEKGLMDMDNSVVTVAGG